MFIKPWERALREGEPQPGGGGGFDPVKFKIELLADVGNLMKTQLGELAKTFKPADPKPDEKPEPKPDPAPAGDGKPADPALASLQGQVREMQAKLEASEKARQDAVKAAEERERTSAIRAKLGDFQFASDAARESALRIFGSDVVRGEDGNLYGPDKTTPFDQYIGKALDETHDYLLKPKDVGGSGAMNPGQKRQPPVDLNDIKPGMKPEDRARVLAEIERLGSAA
jgi:hypothetical protein